MNGTHSDKNGNTVSGLPIANVDGTILVPEQFREVYGYIRVYLDVSTSMRIVSAELARAFNKFLAELGENWVRAGGDPKKLHVAVKVFNSRIKKLGEFRSVTATERWNERTYDEHAGFGTALRDALYEGAVKSEGLQLELYRMRPQPFIGVVVLSDGQDSQSTHQLPETREAVTRAVAKGIRFSFCFVGTSADQVMARHDATCMGIPDATVVTAEKTEAGLDESMTMTAHTLFEAPHR